MYYVPCLEFNIQVRHAFKEVKQSFLGHHQSSNYSELVDELLSMERTQFFTSQIKKGIMYAMSTNIQYTLLCSIRVSVNAFPKHSPVWIPKNASESTVDKISS